MNDEGRMKVRFAYGMSPEFRRGGENGCGNGAVQGGDDSPAKWCIFEDPFHTWWEREWDGGVEVPWSEWETIVVKGFGYMDDKKPLEASVARLQEWYEKSSTWSFFHGLEADLVQS